MGLIPEIFGGLLHHDHSVKAFTISGDSEDKLLQQVERHAHLPKGGLSVEPDDSLAEDFEPLRSKRIISYRPHSQVGVLFEQPKGPHSPLIEIIGQGANLPVHSLVATIWPQTNWRLIDKE